jgi:hypothetical protein
MKVCCELSENGGETDEKILIQTHPPDMMANDNIRMINPPRRAVESLVLEMKRDQERK